MSWRHIELADWNSGKDRGLNMTINKCKTTDELTFLAKLQTTGWKRCEESSRVVHSSTGVSSHEDIYSSSAADQKGIPNRKTDLSSPNNLLNWISQSDQGITNPPNISFITPCVIVARRKNQTQGTREHVYRRTYGSLRTGVIMDPRDLESINPRGWYRNEIT